MQSGAVADVGTGHAIRLLPASKQFDTRTCARCAGLLVNEWYYDSGNTGEHNVEALRCVQCGHRVDPVIVQNQIPTVDRKPARTACAATSTRVKHSPVGRRTHDSQQRTS